MPAHQEYSSKLKQGTVNEVMCKNLNILHLEPNITRMIKRPIYSYKRNTTIYNVSVQEDPLDKYKIKHIKNSDKKGCFNCNICNLITCSDHITQRHTYCSG